MVPSWASSTARPVTGMDARGRTGSTVKEDRQDRLRSGRGGCAPKEGDHQPDETLDQRCRELGPARLLTLMRVRMMAANESSRGIAAARRGLPEP